MPRCSGVRASVGVERERERERERETLGSTGEVCGSVEACAVCMLYSEARSGGKGRRSSSR